MNEGMIDWMDCLPPPSLKRKHFFSNYGVMGYRFPARQTQSINLFLHSFTFSLVKNKSTLCGSSCRLQRKQNEQHSRNGNSERIGMEWWGARGAEPITHNNSISAEPPTNWFHSQKFTPSISLAFHWNVELLWKRIKINIWTVLLRDIGQD